MRKYLAILLIISLFSCEKTHEGNETENFTSEELMGFLFSCKINETEITSKFFSGAGTFTQQLFKINDSDKDSFILGEYITLANGKILIGFSKKMLLDQSFSLIDYNISPEKYPDIKEQLFTIGPKRFSEIWNFDEGFFINYTENDKSFDAADDNEWRSYLKVNPGDESVFKGNTFQENSLCEILEVSKYGEHAVYIEAAFNCLLYHYQTGDTLKLTDGVLKCIF